MYINYNFNTNYVTLDHSFLVDFYLFLKKNFYNHLLCVDTHTTVSMQRSEDTCRGHFLPSIMSQASKSGHEAEWLVPLPTELAHRQALTDTYLSRVQST